MLVRESERARGAELESIGAIWSTYALLDPSYVQTQSWGFWVDTGNGFVTIVPTMLMTVGATYDLGEYGISPLVYGLIGLIFNYQMMYGTIIYFSNFVYQRYLSGEFWE